MIELNFSQIRNHDGSQDNGFEELVCQLAHLSSPDNADYFVRKDGAGGDAGVECYWRLADGSEHAWQAKYFLETIDSSQWTQISGSVESALNKHPQLTKYYVCLPRDWTDSRKKGRGGTTVTTAWDKWQEHVTIWEKLADDRGMKVEFTYWCKHEMSQLLQCDQPEFAGRAHYWFGTPILGNVDFRRLTEKSKVALGERYTPEYHLDLPIAKVFEALGHSPKWWKETEDEVNAWIDGASRAETSISGAISDIGKGDIWEVKEAIDDLRKNLQSGLSNRSILHALKSYCQSLDELSSKMRELTDALFKESNLTDESAKNTTRSNLYKFDRLTRFLDGYFKSNSCNAALKRNVLLKGEAGIGKSHLLCDVALSRIEELQPTVFVLGQHYSGGNPISTLKESLDLSTISDDIFLGALDAAGEAKRTNTLIIIDAINEGNSREDWPSFISGLLTDLKRFSHISIVLSCRTTYVEWLIPDDVVEKQLLEVTHYGFRGFEHRAAANYLSQQGIVKPSAPITSPEFTNPLFLKTCCKAMREEGLSAFPKGLNGLSALLEFYIRSIEKTISKIKRYRSGEQIVHKALEAFALRLYPDRQFGLDVSEAVNLVNSFDSRPGVSETLFDLLLHEGVISEDMAIEETNGRREKVVVRFTYERFSDFFIASSLIESLDEDDIEEAFSNAGCFAPLVSDSYYKYLGILTALSIIIAEKYCIELIDILPDEIVKDEWLFDHIFTDTIQWRAASSFTDRTKELLNSIPEQGFYSRRLDILLGICSEPDHPWNAEMLHKTLMSHKMPERDAFWTTHVTIADAEEGDGQGESIERALIDWAQSGSLEGVEPERIRLCSVILVWLTSSSNRKVRDQATKSAVRILSVVPELLVSLLEKFKNIDDLYVLERLYAIVYGVVTNCGNGQALEEVARWVWENQFLNGMPTPHLLLRDYASGILEYAFLKEMTAPGITQDKFRPPYDSEWPLSILSAEEIKDLFGDDYSLSIKSSIMGFPGDFGNYTMSSVHQWSPTSINLAEPETAHDLQIKFADEYLKGDLRSKFINYLNDKRKSESEPVDIAQIRVVFVKKDKEKVPTESDLLKEEVENALNIDQKECFRWVMGLGRADSPGAFSRKMAQRWVCRRAVDLGWTKDRFEEFEKYHIGSSGRSYSTIERIGKKYQWIAFHEFLAHLADNCCYIDPGYSDVDYSKYFGPWQIHARDIDPTFTQRSTGDTGWNKEKKECWWQPFVYPFSGVNIDELQNWLWDEKVVPPFDKLLEVDDRNGNNWLVLRNFASWEKRPKEEKNTIPYQDAWYRINSCIIHKKDFDKVKESVLDKNLCDPHILKPNSTGHQGFLGEYPWHPIYKDMVGWNTDFDFRIECDAESLVAVSEYEWGSGSLDNSLENSISVYLPAKQVIEGLNLHSSKEDFCCWSDEREDVIFFDPGLGQRGPSASLCRTNQLSKWLEENDLQVVWFVGGEKQLFTHWASKFYGRLVYSGIYTHTAKGIQGDLWFAREDPDIK